MTDSSDKFAQEPISCGTLPLSANRLRFLCGVRAFVLSFIGSTKYVLKSHSLVNDKSEPIVVGIAPVMPALFERSLGVKDVSSASSHDATHYKSVSRVSRPMCDVSVPLRSLELNSLQIATK